MNDTAAQIRGLVPGLLLTMGLAGCGEAAPSMARQTTAPIEVTATAAWAAEAGREFPGRMEAARQADVATRASGVLRSMPVDVGDRVRTGQVIAVLDGTDVSAQIRGAQAQHNLAEQTHGRVSRLAAQGAASQQELDLASANLESAAAALESAQAQATYVQVLAPFAGVVSARMADPGDLAVPGRPVLRIQGLGALHVVADLPADAQSLVEVGTALTVRGSDGSVPATVSRAVPALDPQSRRFRIEAELNAAVRWQSGAVVTLVVAQTGDGTRWIPEDAVVRRGQLTGVFNVESDTLRLRWLRLGRAAGGAVEVLSAPATELMVVRRPGSDVTDGGPVSRVTVETAR
jgi:RND family efflux transporter MFP subunit